MGISNLFLDFLLGAWVVNSLIITVLLTRLVMLTGALNRFLHRAEFTVTRNRVIREPGKDEL